jgi:autonomous glycyl radical cofactor GrcA
MRIHIVRNRQGEIVGTCEAGEVQTTSGTVEVEPELEDGQRIETVELLRRETFDLEALHKRPERKK